jgi:NADH dehydrogenase
MRVLIIGGGTAGVFAARKLQRPLAAAGHDLTLVNEENFMQYQSFLPEAAGGTIEPRHVVVPLRQVLRKTRIVVGEITRMDPGRRIARVLTPNDQEFDVPYDVVVLTPGSRSKVLPIPGLAERGVGFKTVTEAIHLRNRVLRQLDAAAETTEPEQKRAALTFVFVGGGYAGVEAIGELEDLARSALRYYPMISPEEMRWVLIEAADAILPEIGLELGQYATAHLRSRGIDVLLRTQLESAEGGMIQLSTGHAFPAETLVWTAGVRAMPLAAQAGFPVDETGRVEVDEFLRVKGLQDAWSAGDTAAVLDLETGGFAPPTAQHAIREARCLAHNLLATIHGHELEPFRYRALGQLCSLGRYKGVAKVLGISLRGFPAWFVARSYHLARVPTLSRKVRIVLDWTVGLFFARDLAQLGSLQDPREPFERAAEEDPS